MSRGGRRVTRGDGPTRRIRRARRLWLLMALVVLAVGIPSTSLAVLNEADVARERDRSAFDRDAADTAAELRLELQHQNDLVVSASAFAADNVEMTNADMRRWVASVRAVERYPEMVGVSFVRHIRSDELPAYVELAAADPDATPSAPDGTFAVVPPGERDSYCFIQAFGYASIPMPVPSTLDLCVDAERSAVIGELTGTGDVSSYDIAVGYSDDPPLSINTAVYRGGAIPTDPAEREDLLVGLVSTLIDMPTLVERVVAGHDGMAVTLQYTDRNADTTFAAGPTSEGGHETRVQLLPGWTATIAAPADAIGFLDGSNLFTSLGGFVATVLLAVLVYVLGTSRARALALVEDATGELRHLALHDPLTGLPNRALITDRADALLARGRRDGTIPCALFMDLDGFKDVNDSLGHAAGDQLLCAVAERLERALRGTDTIGRLGGDEFVVLIECTDAAEGPQLVAERILEVTREPLVVGAGGTPLSITASVGIAMGDRDDADDMLRDADIALYEAKAAGRNCWRVFGSHSGSIERNSTAATIQ